MEQDTQPDQSTPPAPSTEPGSPDEVEPVHTLERKFVTWGLVAVAVLCVLGAILHSIWPDRIDKTTAGFVALAAAAVIFPYVKKLKIFEVQFEVRDEVRKQLQPVKRRVELIEDKAGLPGRPPIADGAREPLGKESVSIAEGESGTAKMMANAKGKRRADEDEEWESDPNHGKFNGLSQRDGWKLSARIRPAGSKTSPACHIQLRVEAVSNEAKQPQDGKVTLFLHPTFGKWERYTLRLRGGSAEDRITSWGAFTVGAIVGETKLELDLAKVEGGTRKFYDQ